MFRASGNIIKNASSWGVHMGVPIYEMYNIYFLHIKYKCKSIYLFIAKTLFCNELEVIWTADSTELTPKKANKKWRTAMKRDNKIVLLSQRHCERPFLLALKSVPIKTRYVNPACLSCYFSLLWQNISLLDASITLTFSLTLMPRENKLKKKMSDSFPYQFALVNPLPSEGLHYQVMCTGSVSMRS